VSPNSWRNLGNQSRILFGSLWMRQNGGSAKGLAEPPVWREVGGTSRGQKSGFPAAAQRFRAGRSMLKLALLPLPGVAFLPSFLENSKTGYPRFDLNQLLTLKKKIRNSPKR